MSGSGAASIAAAVRLQARLRRLVARKRHVAEMAARQEAAVSVQAHYRGHHDRTEQHTKQEARHGAATVMAAHCRGLLERRDRPDSSIPRRSPTKTTRSALSPARSSKGDLRVRISTPERTAGMADPRTLAEAEASQVHDAARAHTAVVHQERERYLAAQRNATQKALAGRRPRHTTTSNHQHQADGSSRGDGLSVVPAPTRNRAAHRAAEWAENLMDSVEYFYTPTAFVDEDDEPSRSASYPPREMRSLARPQSITHLSHAAAFKMRASGSQSTLSHSSSAPRITCMTSPPLSLSGSLPRLQLLGSSSKAKLHVELHVARAAATREADKARRYNWSVAAATMQQDYRREAHRSCLRKERLRLAQQAKDRGDQVKQASQWEGEKSMWRERGHAASSLLMQGRKPTLTVWRSQSLPVDTFASGSTPRAMTAPQMPR